MFRGPLRSTPQGWVVLVCTFVYLVLALVLYFFESKRSFLPTEPRIAMSKAI